MELIEMVVYLIVIVVLHEAGHIGTIVLSKGGKIEKLSLTKKGLQCYWVPFRTNWNLFALVSLSGPMVNLLLAITFFTLLPIFSYYNFLFGVLNLLLPGSDGWNAIKRLRQINKNLPGRLRRLGQ